MKFALFENNKIEATKGGKGVCPCCGSELSAKCGEKRVNHWAHKGNRTCDSWWEPETEWHRTWKNNYSTEWQEVILTDKNTDEKHIADVRTSHNLVIEFQHSPIDPKERSKREMFYQNMVWIVDGTRLKKDYQRFLKGKKDFLTLKKGIFLINNPENVFPINWLNSSVPVLFDFKGLETIQDIDDPRNNLYCLLQVRVGRTAIFAEITRKAFINTTIDGNWSSRVQKFIEILVPSKLDHQDASSKKTHIPTINREGTHYYDNRKGRFIKRWRF